MCCLGCCRVAFLSIFASRFCCELIFASSAQVYSVFQYLPSIVLGLFFFPQVPRVDQLLKRIKALEDAQSVASVESVLAKIAKYGFRREEDFDKYEALHLAKQLAVTARLVTHPKAPSYDVIASTLRQKLACSVPQFKAYFTALLADKDYGKILDALHKVDKPFKSKGQEKPLQTSATPLWVQPRSVPRIVCYSCCTPGHISPNCFRRFQSPAAHYHPYPRLRSTGPPNNTLQHY